MNLGGDIIVRTPSLAAAKAFYRDVMGFRLTSETSTLLAFEAGAFHLYVEAGEAHGPVNEVFAPDFAAAKRALLAAGCTLVEEDASAPRCYLRDPYGLVFNLAQARE